jgi:hypothetical protein
LAPFSLTDPQLTTDSVSGSRIGDSCVGWNRYKLWAWRKHELELGDSPFGGVFLKSRISR